MPGVFFWGVLVKRQRRLLNPEFVEAVRNAPMTRNTIAQLVGYGPYHSNLLTDLKRPDGPAPTPLVRERMAKLARLVSFPEERVWLE